MPASSVMCRPAGSASSLSPAPSGSDVVSGGRSTTAQCQKQLVVGALGSYIVTMKLRVGSGNPDHDRSGETSWPPAPKMPLRCATGTVTPSATTLLLNWKAGAAGNSA